MFGNNYPYLETDPKIGEGRHSLEEHPTEPPKLQADRAFCFRYNATNWKSTTTVVTKLQEYSQTDKRRTRLTFESNAEGFTPSFQGFRVGCSSESEICESTQGE